MLITSCADAAEETATAEALEAGCRWLLLRDVHAEEETLLRRAEKLRKRCDATAAKLYISRQLKVALNAGADGLHLSAQQDATVIKQCAGALTLGQSCHTMEEIRRAESGDVDYISLSPIFPSISKPQHERALGLDTLNRFCKSTSLPVLALGGITFSQTKNAMLNGAKGIAVAGAFFSASDRKSEMRRFLEALQG